MGHLVASIDQDTGQIEGTQSKVENTWIHLIGWLICIVFILVHHPGDIITIIFIG